MLTSYKTNGHRIMETIAENSALQNKAIQYELEIKCLIEAIELQAYEIHKRDAVIFNLAEEITEKNEKIELFSKHGEEKGLPECKVCCRNTDIVVRCDNHSDDDNIVGCVFCALKKCPLCRSENIYQSKLSKKINKCGKKSVKKSVESQKKKSK